MNVHKNARLTPRGRERIARQVASGQTPKAVSEAAGVCPRTVRKWVDRYRREGHAGLRDRSSRPHRLYRPTPQAIVDKVAALRRQRCTGKQIAAQVGVSPATVSRILQRLGLNRLSALEPAEPVRRYEREHPGEMIHIDIKKLGRIDGVGHRITGDRRGQSNRRSRGEGWAGSSSMSPSTTPPASPSPRSWPARGSAVPPPSSKPRRLLRKPRHQGRARHDRQRLLLQILRLPQACKRLGLKHIRTKPYTPKTNGKAERFIQTCLREWAYAQAYHHSRQRTEQLPYWLHRYNWHRPHAGIGAKTPISRLGLAGNNLLRLHS